METGGVSMVDGRLRCSERNGPSGAIQAEVKLILEDGAPCSALEEPTNR